MKETFFCNVSCSGMSRTEEGTLGDETYLICPIYAVSYADRISKVIASCHASEGCSPEDQARYLKMPKVRSAEWGIKTENVIRGTVTVELDGELAASEREELVRKINGANADGFGEVIRQEPFETRYGVGYISFGDVR